MNSIEIEQIEALRISKRNSLRKFHGAERIRVSSDELRSMWETLKEVSVEFSLGNNLVEIDGALADETTLFQAVETLREIFNLIIITLADLEDYEILISGLLDVELRGRLIAPLVRFRFEATS